MLETFMNEQNNPFLPPFHAQEHGTETTYLNLDNCTTGHLYLCLFSLSKVGLYSDSVKDAVVVMEEVGGGVTHMRFSQDGNLLYTGFRKVS